jgi:hypothetical protein
MTAIITADHWFRPGQQFWWAGNAKGTASGRWLYQRRGAASLGDGERAVSGKRASN